MRIAYYSNIYFTDSDFSLIREYQRKGVDVFYFVNIYSNHLSGGLLSFNSIPSYGIINACAYEEFQKFSGFLNLKNVYLVTRTPKWYSIINIKTSLKFLLLILRKRFDIIHIGYELGFSECILYLFRKKIVMTVHDPFFHSGEGSSYGEIKRKIAFRLIPCFIILNKNQQKQFTNYYKLSKKSINTNCFGTLDGHKYIANLHKTTKTIEGDYILYFGHFSPYKGLDVLCEAMDVVHQKLPELKCVIVGKGYLDFDISFYSDRSYIIIDNRFLEVNELGGLISSCLFVVCPYKDATQSGVVVTTYAYGKPILSTNVGGMPESVIDNVTGRIVEPNKPKDLADKIIKMAKDKNTLLLYSKNIEKRYSEGELSWSMIADKNVRLYEERIL